MKKVLIISYFAPPCSLTPSNRIAGWMQNLIKFGYYPIVITRHWDKEISSIEDGSIGTQTDVKIETTDKYEIHHLPYKPGFNEVLFEKLKGTRLQFLSKFITVIQLIRENFFISALPYKNIFDYADQYLIENQEVKKMVISANPFNQFHFGYQLKKHHDDLIWIADYRDDWTTSSLKKPKGIQLLLHKLQQINERKWVGSAAHITSVSPHYVSKISAFTGIKGSTLQNGFDTVLTPLNSVDKERFNIVFNGSLYPTQEIELFLETLKKMIKQFNGQTHIHIDFPGVAFYPAQLKRIQNSMLGYENHFTTSSRIPKELVIKKQQESDILLMLSHTGIKGVPSSKLYEYLSLQKPILFFPNDYDIIETTLLDTKSGYICENSFDLKETLEKLILRKMNGEKMYFGDLGRIMDYSVENQTKILAQVFDKLETN